MYIIDCGYLKPNQRLQRVNPGKFLLIALCIMKQFMYKNESFGKIIFLVKMKRKILTSLSGCSYYVELLSLETLFKVDSDIVP